MAVSMSQNIPLEGNRVLRPGTRSPIFVPTIPAKKNESKTDMIVNGKQKKRYGCAWDRKIR